MHFSREFGWSLSIAECNASAVTVEEENLISLICSLRCLRTAGRAGAVVQLVSVTSVWPALLLMQVAVSCRCWLL